MPSRESIEFLQERRRTPAFGDPGNDFDLAALRRCMGARQAPADPSVACIPCDAGGVPCAWVLAPGADAGLRLLYLHGGGFVSGCGANYLPLAADLSAAAGCAVLLADYRLAPEHPFPAGLEDCLAAYGWMLAAGPFGPGPARAAFVAGDSAGGCLTLATLLALRDRGQRLPAAGVALSPCTDLTLASESLRTVQDPICSARCMPVFAALYLGGADPRNPLASPVFGDFAGLPPLLIQAGEVEMLRDDSVRVAARARAGGVPATLEIWPGMVHVFQIRGLPESRQAIARIAEFLRSCIAP